MAPLDVLGDWRRAVFGREVSGRASGGATSFITARPAKGDFPGAACSRYSRTAGSRQGGRTSAALWPPGSNNETVSLGSFSESFRVRAAWSRSGSAWQR